MESATRVCVLSCLSRVRLLATLWTVARQAPLSMGFSRHEYWSRLPFPSPGDLPDPGIKPRVCCIFCLASRFYTAEPPGQPSMTLSWVFVKFHAVNDFPFEA